MVRSVVEYQDEDDRFEKRGRRLRNAAVVVSVIAFAVLVANRVNDALVVVPVLFAVSSGIELWLALGRRRRARARAARHPPFLPPLARDPLTGRPGPLSLAARPLHQRALTAYGSILRGRWLVAESPEPIETVRARLAAACEAEGVRWASGPAPDGVTARLEARLRPAQRLDLAGTAMLRSGPPTTFSSVFRRDLDLLVSMLVPALFLLAAPAAFIGGAIGVLSGRNGDGGAAFAMIWGMLALFASLSWMRLITRGFERHVRLLQRVFGDRVRLVEPPRPAPPASPTRR